MSCVCIAWSCVGDFVAILTECCDAVVLGQVKTEKSGLWRLELWSLKVEKVEKVEKVA